MIEFTLLLVGFMVSFGMAAAECENTKQPFRWYYFFMCLVFGWVVVGFLLFGVLSDIKDKLKDAT